jgi:hypothetical protein
MGRSAKRTAAEWLQTAKQFAARGFTLISAEKDYTNSKSALAYRCRCGKECRMSRKSLQEGRDACPKCKQEKTRNTNRQRYGTDYPMQSTEIQEKIRATNIERYGVDSPLQSALIQKKVQETIVKRYGVKNPMHIAGVPEKVAATNLERYGVNTTLLDPEVQEKIKTTNREQYGVENPFQSMEIREKIRATNQVRFGVDNPAQSAEVQEKIRATNRERLGVDNPTQNAEVQEKIRATNLERYGVSCTMQNADVLRKAQKSRFLMKSYQLPSGTPLECQGYEPFALAELLDEGIDEQDLIDGHTQMPIIKYLLNNEPHCYHPDIYLPSANKLIEVKSLYTATCDITKLSAKLHACKSTGFLVELRLYDRKGDRLREDETRILAQCYHVQDELEISDFIDRCWADEQNKTKGIVEQDEIEATEEPIPPRVSSGSNTVSVSDSDPLWKELGLDD